MNHSKVEAIEREFKDCLGSFPELKDQNIIPLIQPLQELSGTIRRCDSERLFILSVPPVLMDKPQTLRPIIFHELCCLIDPSDPDRVFMERADEKWRAGNGWCQHKRRPIFEGIKIYERDT